MTPADRPDDHVGPAAGGGTGRGPEGEPTQTAPRPRRHRRHRPNGQRRPRTSLLRLGDAEHAALTAAAERAGLTLAGYCAAASLAAARGTQVPGSMPHQALLELIAARSAVARVGSNINQIARAANAGAELSAPQLEGYLRVAQAAAQRLEVAAQAVARRLA